MTPLALNTLDRALQSLCPTVMVPRHEPLADLTEEGHRFLSCADGLYLDLVRPWLHLRLQVAESRIAMPYGTVQEKADFLLGNNFQRLLQQFIQEAREAMPNEHAAWFSFDMETQNLCYAPVGINRQNPVRITYERPRVPATHRLAVDIHSHGCARAEFSALDDRDDIDDVKLSIVIGHLDRDTIDISARLVLMGGVNIDYSDFVHSYC